MSNDQGSAAADPGSEAAPPAPTSGHARWRTWFAGDALDRTFAVGILLKGLDGVLELVAGFALLLATPQRIEHLVSVLTSRELAEDPTDLLATWLVHVSTVGVLSSDTLRFAAFYLLAHGVVKVVLVGAVWRERLWAYPWMIGFLLVFIGYQVYRIAVAPTAGLIALTVFDAALVWLTVREWQRHRSAR